jgi:hypothetical protein
MTGEKRIKDKKQLPEPQYLQRRAAIPQKLSSFAAGGGSAVVVFRQILFGECFKSVLSVSSAGAY